MARNRIFYGLFLLAAVVFHSFYTGWFSFFLLLFSVLLPVFSLLVSLPAMLRAGYVPQLPLRCFCGQDAQFTLQPSSVSRLPVSCCRLHLLVCDAVGGTQQAEWLTLAGTLCFSLRVDTRHAGQQTFRVDRARVYDALGLVGLPLQLPDACSIAVEPEPLEPAERISSAVFDADSAVGVPSVEETPFAAVPSRKYAFCSVPLRTPAMPPIPASGPITLPTL